jgi:hypothetical protein
MRIDSIMGNIDDEKIVNLYNNLDKITINEDMSFARKYAINRIKLEIINQANRRNLIK